MSVQSNKKNTKVIEHTLEGPGEHKKVIKFGRISGRVMARIDEGGDLDVGNLPSLVISDEALTLVQQITNNPTDKSLQTRLQDSMFSDPIQAKAIILTAQAELIPDSDGAYYTTKEFFEDIPPFVSSDLEFETIDEPNIELEGEFEDEEQQKGEGTNSFEDEQPSTSKGMEGCPISELFNSLSNKLDLMNDTIINKLTLDPSGKLLTGIKSDIMEMKGKLTNIEETLTTMKGDISNIYTRLGIRAEAPPVIPKKTIYPVKEVNTSNLEKVIAQLVAKGAIPDNDTDKTLFSNFLKVKDIAHIEAQANSFGIKLEDDQLLFLQNTEFRTKVDCENVVGMIAAARKHATMLEPKLHTITPVTTGSVKTALGKRPSILEKMSST